MTNIQKGLELQGHPAEIPDTWRDDLPQFFVDMGYKVGAEIGVWRGSYTEKFCQVGLKTYAIDPWLCYPGYRNPGSQKRFDTKYEYAKKLLAPYPNCTIVRKTSMDALADFPDGSLDWVYIDANHLFRYVAEDLVEWTKKVRKGGVVAGHDYYYSGINHQMALNHVKQVLHAYTDAYGIRNWYVLGRKNTIEGEKRDPHRSWFFIKE